MTQKAHRVLDELNWILEFEEWEEPTRPGLAFQCESETHVRRGDWATPGTATVTKLTLAFSLPIKCMSTGLCLAQVSQLVRLAQDWLAQSFSGVPSLQITINVHP